MQKSVNFIADLEWKFSSKLVPYQEALDFMEKRVEEINLGKSPQMIWILEHPAIYTAGISAKDEDLLDKHLLSNINAGESMVVRVNRGGKYSYHCPGMKIIYLMLDLKRFFAPQSPDISCFVRFIENWIIAILAEYKIRGEVRQKRVGIWVESEDGEKKIAAIGIKLKKWVSYHGAAINVDCDLSGFKKIVPCGISEFGITSIQELISSENLALKADFERIAKEKFFQIFSKKPKPSCA